MREMIREFPPIILASSSPRRKELLEGLKLPFTVHPSRADETVPEGMAPERAVEELSLRKALSVAQEYDRGIVIGSDTVVVLDGEIFGKPLNHEEAFAMLSRLQGRTHTVYTGLALVDAASGEREVAHQSTQVELRPMDPQEIERYIATGEPMDKAGAYAIQGLGATLVKGIVGDYFTVVGFPLALLASRLKRFGIEII